jgi:hypothetical protein
MRGKQNFAGREARANKDINTVDEHASRKEEQIMRLRANTVPTIRQLIDPDNLAHKTSNVWGMSPEHSRDLPQTRQRGQGTGGRIVQGIAKNVLNAARNARVKSVFEALPCGEVSPTGGAAHLPQIITQRIERAAPSMSVITRGETDKAR